VLSAAGVPVLRMSGELSQCMRSLAAFGRTPDAPRVLLLSSQHHASGINLQCARNLIVVHPYCTPSAGEPEDVSFAALQAFEQQAIGRIRRCESRARAASVAGESQVADALSLGSRRRRPADGDRARLPAVCGGECRGGPVPRRIFLHHCKQLEMGPTARALGSGHFPYKACMKAPSLVCALPPLLSANALAPAPFFSAAVCQGVSPNECE
jgi:hypothetical protein